MSSRPDRLTLVALGVLAFALKATLHEWVGHGGAAVIAGCVPEGVSSAWWSSDCSALADPEAAVRLVKAGGTIANLIAAALAGGVLAALRGRPGTLGAGAYFAWLVLVTNLLSGGGYMMVDPLFGFGDWSAFIESLGLPWMRWVIIGLGLGFSLLGLVVGRRLLLPWLGEGAEERRARSRALGLLPYLAGATIVPLSAALNPHGAGFVATSALSTFGGCAWLVWIAFDPLVSRPEPRRGVVERRPGWLVAGALAALFLFAVLGPGIEFGAG
ncbi:MAG: hypothetical protein H6711_25085 [Myxococcales bacterium]|nr:hypothetical protein [Myxococcales bacterium]